MNIQNIFHGIPASLPEEQIDVLLKSPHARIERIVSRGHATPGGFWYDQAQGEWVLLLKGQAALAFAGEEDPVILKPGDFLNIPAHCRHRVLWTDPEKDTVWLAVHY